MSKPLISTLLKYGKIGWVILVLISLGWVVLQPSFLEALKHIDPISISLAVVCVMIAHCGVLMAQHEAISAFGQRIGWRNNLNIFNPTNLSKYIPLSGANLAVNGVLISRTGLSPKESTFAILLVTYWTVLGSFAFGGIGVLIWLDFPLIVSIILPLLFWITFCASRPERILNINHDYKLIVQIFGQVLLWGGYGAGFTIILGASDVLEGLRIGSAYTLSFGVGILAIFAPSGVGVREVVSAWLLSDIKLETVLSAALFMRLAILIADLIFFIATTPLARLGSGNDNKNTVK